MNKLIKRQALRGHLRWIAEDQAIAQYGVKGSIIQATEYEGYISRKIAEMMAEINKLPRCDNYHVQYSLDGTFAIFGA